MALIPFTLKSSLKLDIKVPLKLNQYLLILIGAYHVDTHKQLKKAWKTANKLKNKDLIAALTKAPITKAELLKLAR